jgi:hypothetical protein
MLTSFFASYAIEFVTESFRVRTTVFRSAVICSLSSVTGPMGDLFLKNIFVGNIPNLPSHLVTRPQDDKSIGVEGSG